MQIFNVRNWAIAARPLLGWAHWERNDRNWWLAAVRLADPKWVPWVPANELVNLPQALWKRLGLLPSRVIYKAKSGKPERADLGPLLVVRLFWHLERTPHRVKRAAAFWALANSFVWQLPRFPAFKAGVRPEAAWAAKIGD
ncbi:hypothetical protein [Sphingomonas sp. Leaf33]|uniref:hypothetical protein n=1 Tax=Sphingomonas sp. Leaf33 TaxID=1736215 RepID=UPI00138EED9E|nr:hypothetical protein [Sphingomonas sp. Leaf33]